MSNQRSWEPKPINSSAGTPEPGTPGGGYKKGGLKFMKNGLRYGGKCRETGKFIPAGDLAWYDFDTKEVVSIEAKPEPDWFIEEKAKEEAPF